MYYTIDNAIYYRHIKVAEKLIEQLKALPIDDEEAKRQDANGKDDIVLTSLFSVYNIGFAMNR
jgi:hypothetical protein